MIDIALKYHNAGLSVVPVGRDKRPALSDDAENGYTWTPHQHKLIKPNGIFDKAKRIGLVCGKISGTEVIDIDTKYDLTGTLFEDYKKAINAEDKDLLKKLTVQKTVSGGYHFIYRCEKIDGNKKLASRLATPEELKIKNEKQKAFLETRGEGGFILIEPSEGYKIVYGDLLNIQTITPTERDLLISIAQGFDQVPPPVIPVRKNQFDKQTTFGLSTFDDYNDRGDTVSDLVEAGWKIIKSNSKNIFFLRPGGDGKWSATFSPELKVFYVFTSSSEFEVNKGYNPSQVYSILKFKGNYSEAAKHLYSIGFGERVGKQEQPKAPKKEFLKALDFLANEEKMNDYIHKWRTGTFQLGRKTGMTKVDEHFRFKDAQLVICNGHDNVGKSLVAWYFAVLSSILHGFKWGICSAENKSGSIKKKIMELYIGKGISLLNDKEFDLAERFFTDNFFLIANDELYSAEDVLGMASVLVEEKKINYFLIDPYNALERDASNYHEYDYKVASKFRHFSEKTGCGIWINAHAVTESLRKVYGKESEFMGYPMPPNKADTEGGGKFSNKADDFITIHRLVEHKDLYSVTEIYVRKVKETETGGKATVYQQPIKLAMNPNGCGFTEISENQDPIKEYWYKQQHPEQAMLPMKPNTSFDTEPPLKVARHHMNLNKDEVETERPTDTPF